MCYHINHIIKLEFLPVFKVAFYNLIIKSNIYTSFQGISFVLLDPEAVLLKLNIRLCMPSPPVAIKV